MTSDECTLKDECLTFLVDFPDRVPHRCSLCTPIVRFILESLKKQNEYLPKESDLWNNGAYDG